MMMMMLKMTTTMMMIDDDDDEEDDDYNDDDDDYDQVEHPTSGLILFCHVMNRTQGEDKSGEA